MKESGIRSLPDLKPPCELQLVWRALGVIEGAEGRSAGGDGATTLYALHPRNRAADRPRGWHDVQDSGQLGVGSLKPAQSTRPSSTNSSMS